MCVNFFEINVSQDILTFWDFTVSKFAFHNKIINKTSTTKTQENSAHHFGEKHLANHLVKFLQDSLNPKEF